MRRLPSADLVLAFGAVWLLAGCSSPDPPPPPPPPPVLNLSIVGSAEQNPNPDGTATPVAVHLYQLASTQKFAVADVFALIEHEPATFGPDLLAADEFVLLPAEKRMMKQPLKPGSQALGVVVLYQNIDNAQWRASAPVAANGPTNLTLTVGKLTVSLKPTEK